MEKVGINMVDMKTYNRLSILKLLNANGAMSRKDIAATLELTPAAITVLCQEMIEEGLIIQKGEAAEEERRAGRKKLLIDINRCYKYIIGMNIESDFTYLSISDLKGSAVKNKRLVTDNAAPPEKYLEMLANECIQMLWTENIAKEQILGVGVGIVGAVDRTRGISKLAYAIWKEEVPVKRILEQILQFPVLVENNVRAFALGEILYGKYRDADNMFFLKWGPGVGSAILLEHKIFEGENFKSSSLGHFIIDPDGKVCRCGKRGCLETVASKEVLYEYVREVAEQGKAPKLLERLGGEIRKLNVDNVFEYIDAEDAPIRERIDEVINKIAIALSNVTTLLTPQKVLLFGKAFENEEIYQRFLERYKQISNGNYMDGFLGKSSIMEKLNYIGPIAIVANYMFFS